MKKLIIIGALIAPLLSSCDPYGASDNLTIAIPALEFEFDIAPDTAYVKLGDTLTFYASIENPLLETGERLKDGKAILSFTGSWCRHTPVTDEDTTVALLQDEHFLYENNEGEVYMFHDHLNRLFAYPDGGDSIRIAFKFIPLKTGTYGFNVQSNFFEGSQGKTRTKAHFDIETNNTEILMLDNPPITPDMPLFNTLYCFAVYE